MELSAEEIELGDWLAGELLARREHEPKDPLKWWGEIAIYTSKEEAEQKRIANAFLLSCLLDYRRREKFDDSGVAVSKFFSENPEFRDDVWRKICETPYETWCSKKYKLHRESKPHNRLWGIAEAITYWFGGDARLIWKDRDAFSTLTRLYWLGAGEQISRMIVGALKDCGHVEGKCDPKADVRLCRVIGRFIRGDGIDPASAFTAIRICREIHPSDPWELDGPLWLLGETCTDAKPKCTECGLNERCRYFQTGQAG